MKLWRHWLFLIVGLGLISFGLLKKEPSGNLPDLLVEADRTESGDLTHKPKMRDVPRAEPADLEKFDRLTMDLFTLQNQTDGREVYRVFAEWKEEVSTDASLLHPLIALIPQLEKAGPHSHRQMMVLFGVLAQSGNVDLSETLVDIALQCKESFCKRQALMALHSQELADLPSIEKTLALVDQLGLQNEVGVMALLAAGSLAEKGQSAAAQVLAGDLRQRWMKANSEQESVAILRAMGNHGDAAYYELLSEQLELGSTKLRGAAAYAMRSVADSGVAGPQLLKQLKREKDPSVKSEILKALAFRQLTEEQYSQLADLSLSWKDKDLQMHATHVLKLAEEDHAGSVENGLRQIRERSSFAAVRCYAEGNSCVEAH